MDGYENIDAECLRIEREMAEENKRLRTEVERLTAALIVISTIYDKDVWAKKAVMVAEEALNGGE